MVKGELDELDKKIIYYYRNDFPTKKIAEITGESQSRINNKKNRLRKMGLLKRWWKE